MTDNVIPFPVQAKENLDLDLQPLLDSAPAGGDSDGFLAVIRCAAKYGRSPIWQAYLDWREQNPT